MVMKIEELEIKGVFFVTPEFFSDSRGTFFELFQEDLFEQVTGRKFGTKQSNVSISRRYALRGIHFTKDAPGQAKYVTCMSGSILDFIIDLRIGSSTFGKWASIELSSHNNNAVFIPEGVGHAFLSLEDNSKVSYLVSDFYSPNNELAINPLDKDIALDLPIHSSLIISEKDKMAPSFQYAKKNNLLPQNLFLKSNKSIIKESS